MSYLKNIKTELTEKRGIVVSIVLGTTFVAADYALGARSFGEAVTATPIAIALGHTVKSLITAIPR